MNPVIRQLRTAALLRMGDSRSDGQLVEAFADGREEAAFEALLRRHGPMVLGVCRRVLGNVHDADDAFQATFLVLVRKAAAVRPREHVGNWLYGVAYRTSLKARAMSAKRRTKESHAAKNAQSESPAGPDRDELVERLDAELSRLPEKYRTPVVLCELEGKSRKEAARLLGLPEGTLSWRLAQARKMLARRLARHGLPLPAGVWAAAPLSVPPTLLATTAKAGMLMAAGRALTAGAVSAQVVTLTEMVVKTMLLSKLKTVGVLALAVSAIAAAGLTHQKLAAQQVPASDQPAAAQKLSRSAAYDLDELRLEVEALRKGLQATRERVKALEGEVQTLRDRGPGAFGGMGGMGFGTGPSGAGGGARAGGRSFGGGFPGGGGGGFGGPPGMGGGGFGKSGAPGSKPQFPPDGGAAGGKPQFPPGGPNEPADDDRAPRNRPAAGDPFAAAEAALQRIRQRPDDKEAADALEQALKRIRERAKPGGASRE